MTTRKQKQIDRDAWHVKFEAIAKKFGHRSPSKVATKILKRITSTKYSLATRSKKAGVECNVTVDELRQLVLDAYGVKCKYCDKILSVTNFVVDHINPISKGGTSNLDNLQIICKTSNSMKGSLNREHFSLLLDWLQSVPDELRKDVSIRLARGIH